MTQYPSSRSIEYTIRRNCFGYPAIYVRVAIPSSGMGSWRWERWRVANDSQCNDALVKLMELNNV